ncbi:MAG: LysR family transcriptional regulator [Pseudomonadota bacterium]
MSRFDSDLKRLELFQLAASLGSVRAVASETGLSMSTVSYHLSALEDDLGVALIDHKRRPMVLTSAGRVYLKHIEDALQLIRRARAEATAGDALQMRNLRLGLIEDFDSDIGPELAVHLADVMPHCSFQHQTRLSHEILDLVRRRRLDMGLANSGAEDIGDAQEFPMLRDPFALALPVDSTMNPQAFMEGESSLPFLRYSNQQIIGNQIEAQLRRLKITLPHQFEIDSNQTMMAMVAAGAGWAITTPLCYFRARRFHERVALRPFPAKSFARYISLFTTPECSTDIIDMVSVSLRGLIEQHALKPAQKAIPWIEDQFRLMN